jgi:hypothetical protein
MVGTIKIQIPCLFLGMKLPKGINHDGSGRKNPDSNRVGNDSDTKPCSIFSNINNQLIFSNSEWIELTFSEYSSNE